MKSINSKDPRKPAIMAALKQASGGTKVTEVKEVAPGKFQGHCLKPGPHGYGYTGKGYTSLGFHTVELELPAPTPAGSAQEIPYERMEARMVRPGVFEED